MEKENQLSEEFKKEDYIDLLEHSFSDIVALSDGDKELFEELFYNRNPEFVDFRNAAEKLFHNGNNILVIGAAGIGKSNYVYRLFYDAELLDKAKLFPMMFDYRNIAPNNLDGCKLHFIDRFDHFFKEINYDINIKENIKSNIDDNLFKIQKEIKNIPENKLIKHPLLFIDDLDYAEQSQLFEMLDFLSPYARDKRIHILLSVRPPLYHAINNNDFKYRFLFINNVKQIELGPLNIHNVLSMRLAPIIAFNPEHSFFEQITKRMKGLRNPYSKYKKLLKKLGIRNLENLKQFSYPFTDDYINFMAKITNGNLREIFDMAIDSLGFILDNYTRLEEIVINDTTRKVITEDDGVSLFLNNPSSRYKLFDLHQTPNSKGNSLYFNVLEAVLAFGGPSKPGFYDALEKLGHNKEDIDNALKELARRQNRFLISKNFTYAFDNLNEIKKYEISEKGKYYIEEVVKWKKYIEKCGKSKESIIKKIYNEI